MNTQMSLGTFVILLLVIATQATQLYFSNSQLRREQVEIARQFEQQTAQIESAEQLRTQFDGIAGEIARLADEGNVNAVQVREQLAAQGVNIRNTRAD
jgi:hypothetical protein